jgi:hypothetical protein
VSERVVTLLTDEDSFVCIESFCFSLKTLSHVTRPITGIVAQLSDGI